MLRILVPTDFSSNSKKAMRFAIQWSMQQKIELIFFNAFHLATLGNMKYNQFIEAEEAKVVSKLKRFASRLFNTMHCKPAKYSCVAKRGISADISIMDYCRQHPNIDYICIGTHGAGNIDKLFGTNTGNLIAKSEVPVIAIPRRYRKKEVKRILYASDFQDYISELRKVERFTRPLKANIDVVHLTWPGEVMPSAGALKRSSLEKSSYKVDLKIGQRDFDQSLLKNLRNIFNKSNPSLIVMFTDQHKSLLDRLFHPNKTEQLSFTTKIPLLAFHKN